MHAFADSWYASGTFLGVAGMVVAVVVGAAGVWAAFRAANPRRELAYQVLAIVPLLAQQAHSAREVVEIRVDGEILAHPRVVELRLTNRGRRDIPTSAFDQDRPLQLDIGTPIRKILREASVPAGYRAPVVHTDGTVLTLGPDLIKKGQTITLSLLVDGIHPQITVPEPPFIDIDVREQHRNGSSVLIATTTTLVVAAAAEAAIVAAAVTGTHLVTVATTGAVVLAATTALATIATTSIFTRESRQSK